MSRDKTDKRKKFTGVVFLLSLCKACAL